MGGGGSKRVTVGHWLYAYVHVIVCAGPVNKVLEMIYGERTMYKGTVSDNSSISINLPSLFGGEKADGGVFGTVSIEFGKDTQPVNSTVVSLMGGDMPAFRRYLSMMFNNFAWSFIVPQIKPIWVRVESITADWDNGDVWYPEKVSIKRLKGINSNYSIGVTWKPVLTPSPQSISYRLEYRVAGTLDDFTTLGTAAFSGGRLPAPSSNSKNQPNNIVNFTGGSSGAVNQFGLGGIFNSTDAGEIPSGSRTHTVTLIQDAYEFRVVKLSGSGDVTVTSISDSVPTYNDMNVVHALYHFLTQDRWNYKLPASSIDDTSWRNVADIAHLEGYGISATIKSESVKELIEKCLGILNAYLKPNFETGKLELRLMRDDYDLDDLAVIDDDNSELLQHDLALDAADIINTVTVKYLDDNRNEKTITANNLAMVQAAGGVVPTTNTYDWIRTPKLASRLCQRDLRILSTPVFRQKRRINRVVWNHAKGDVVKVVDVTNGIAGAAYRIQEIKEQDDGWYEVDLVEDIFGMEDSTFTPPADVPFQYDPALLSEPEFIKVFELPYLVVHTSLSEAERNALPVEYSYLGAAVTRNEAGAFSYRYDLLQSLSEDSGYIDIADGDYNPTGFIEQSLIKEVESTFNFNDVVDMAIEKFDSVGAVLALIISDAGEEIVGVKTYSEEDLQMTVIRGVCDTVPLIHPAGARLMVLTSANAFDDTQRLPGDELFYRVVPVGMGNKLPEEDADVIEVPVFGRAIRPYPPGDFKINGARWPASVIGLVTLSWAHRDRLMQTVNLVAQDASSIGPEADTTYRITVHDGVNTDAPILVTYGAITGTNYSLDENDIDGKTVLTVVLESIRDGDESWTAHVHTFERRGLGFGLGLRLGE